MSSIKYMFKQHISQHAWRTRFVSYDFVGTGPVQMFGTQTSVFQTSELAECRQRHYYILSGEGARRNASIDNILFLLLSTLDLNIQSI